MIDGCVLYAENHSSRRWVIFFRLFTGINHFGGQKMLANKLIRKNKIYSICEGSGDIQVRESFLVSVSLIRMHLIGYHLMHKLPTAEKSKTMSSYSAPLMAVSTFHCLMAGVLKEEPFMVCHMAFASILNIRRTKKLYYLNVKPSLVHITPGQAQWLIMKESVF